METIVKVIKGNESNPFNYNNRQKKLKVAAYCRVSTDGDEQLNSFNSQLKYYKDKISENKQWELADIYADEAITGTKAGIRDGFQKMINDCMAGKIDIILTKSISRFARNTVDTLNYVRKLKEKGVAIIFEEENINTLTMDGELLLTILSSVAQQEVQNISANVKKGLKMKVQRGEMIGSPECLGYDYNHKDKSISINPDEAEIVKFIFENYAEGHGTGYISKALREMGYKSKKGKATWSTRTILDIISNEKYKGDIMFGKTFTIDPISKKRVRNNGEVDKYYIENHHEAIVSTELWEKANQILEGRRRNIREKEEKFDDFSKKYTFSSIISCAYCGTYFSRRTSEKGQGEYKPVWKCAKQIKEGSRYCNHSRQMDEEALEKGFIEAFNRILYDNSSLIEKFIESINSVLEGSDTTNKIRNIKASTTALEVRRSKLVDLYLDEKLKKEDYDNKISEIDLKVKNNDEEIDRLQRMDKKSIDIKDRLEGFIRTISSNPYMINFDDAVFDTLVSNIIIGGYDENGKENPYIVTYVFNTDKEEIIEKADLVIVDKFLCDYEFTNFIVSKEGFRTRNKMHNFEVRIAIKK